MSKLKTRALSALLFVPIVLGAIYFSAYSFQLLWLFVATVCAFELSNMFDFKFGASTKGSTVIKTLAPLLSLIVGLLLFNGIGNESLYAILLLSSMLIIFIHATFAKDKMPLKHLAGPLIAIFYVMIPLLLLAQMSGIGEQYDPSLPLGLIFLIWASDTGAYFAGSRLGKNKLAPAVSPNKTWEGFFGGLLLSALVGYIYSTLTEKDSVEWILFGLSAGVFGTLGDLFESSLKRYTGIKDSGNIMPGHGGLLDRFDGFFFLIPVCWLIQQIL